MVVSLNSLIVINLSFYRRIGIWDFDKKSCILIFHGYASRVGLVDTGFIVLYSLNPFLAGV